jgi:hypothetical protein
MCDAHIYKSAAHMASPNFLRLISDSNTSRNPTTRHLWCASTTKYNIRQCCNLTHRRKWTKLHLRLRPHRRRKMWRLSQRKRLVCLDWLASDRADVLSQLPISKGFSVLAVRKRG